MDKFKDPKSKVKIKNIKPESEKQIERYKRIMENLLDKSFIHRKGSRKQEEKEKEKPGMMMMNRRKSSNSNRESS